MAPFTFAVPFIFRMPTSRRFCVVSADGSSDEFWMQIRRCNASQRYHQSGTYTIEER